MLHTVKHLGHEISFNTIKTFQCKIAAVHKNPSPTTKTDEVPWFNELLF